jgi:hypothetical protein
VAWVAKTDLIITRREPIKPFPQCSGLPSRGRLSGPAEIVPHA